MRPAARGWYATNRAILRSSSRSPYPRRSHAKRPEHPIVRWIARRTLRQPQGSSVLSLHGPLGIIINGRGVTHQNTQEANPSISRAGHRSSGSRLSADVQLITIQVKEEEDGMMIAPESFAAAVGLYFVGSLVFAALLARVISTAWPGRMLRRHVWFFPLAPIFALLALIRFTLLQMGELADTIVRGCFRLISGKRTYRRIPVDPYRPYRPDRNFRTFRPYR